MERGDGYDNIRRAYNAGVAAAVSCALGKGPDRKAPDADAYVERLKSEPLTATLSVAVCTQCERNLTAGPVLCSRSGCPHRNAA